jgi:hypothetical protein
LSVLWLLLVPWDLSTVDRAGHVYPDFEARGDRAFFRLCAVLLSTACLGAVLSVRQPRASKWFLVGAFFSMLIWYGWRSEAARVLGANFWPISLALAIQPTLILFSAAHLVPGWLKRRRSREQR